MNDLEAKTREIIREEIKETGKSKSPTTYAEMAKVQKESIKLAVKEQKEEDKKEERYVESRKITSLFTESWNLIKTK